MGLQRDARGIKDFAQDSFGLLGFLLGRDVARADHHAVREHGKDEALEIVGQAIVAAFEEGVRAFDSSMGGLGGCPFAPGASGNVVTEDLVFMFESMGLATGIDFDRLLAALVPALTIVMTVLVAIIMAAILLPLLNLTTNIP